MQSGDARFPDRSEAYFGDVAISETEVKRILAKFQPKGIPVAFRVKKVSDSETPLPPAVCELMGVPAGMKTMSHAPSKGWVKYGSERSFC